MFKIAICDDDKNYRRIVKETVSKYSSNIEGIAFYEYSSGEELLADTHQIHNLLFLDIQMAKMDGNETAKEFRTANKSAVLVFCTNYQEPTTESFKVQPYRYIMKDLGNRMLTEEMPDILNEMILTMINISFFHFLMKPLTLMKLFLFLLLLIFMQEPADPASTSFTRCLRHS